VSKGNKGSPKKITLGNVTLVPLPNQLFIRIRPSSDQNGIFTLLKDQHLKIKQINELSPTQFHIIFETRIEINSLISKLLQHPDMEYASTVYINAKDPRRTEIVPTDRILIQVKQPFEGITGSLEKFGLQILETRDVNDQRLIVTKIKNPNSLNAIKIIEKLKAIDIVDLVEPDFLMLRPAILKKN